MRIFLTDRTSHTINLVSGNPRDGAYALYSVVSADKAAILPDHIAYHDGVVVPFALEAAVCVLSLKEEGVAMPGVATPALGLRYPSLHPTPARKTLVIYGGSSSVGSMTTQIATATGIDVISIASAHNFEFCKKTGAKRVFDQKDPDVVLKVTKAVREYSSNDFIGIFDAISTPATYAHDLEILAKFDGTHLACVHPPPDDVPSNLKAGMIFAVNEVATPVWRDFVTPALRTGMLQALPPPTVVGKGLEFFHVALEKSKTVSATKIVVEL